MNITKELKTIKAEAQGEVDFPLVPEFWKGIESLIGNAPGDFDDDPEGQQNYVREYRNVTEASMLGLKFGQPPIKVKPSTDGNGEPPQPKKIYRKCFERRFYIVDFVVGKGHNTKTHRIDWKVTVMEWNKAHPSDIMSLPVLKAEYYRAMREGPLILQYLVTGALKEAGYYRQAYQHRQWVGADTTFKNFEKLIQSVEELVNIHGKGGSTSKFLMESFRRLIDTLHSANTIRIRQLEQEITKVKAQIETAKEAQHERIHTAKG